ncbi:MAG: hypothetical protein DRH37_05040 [Deltaproteobacteria bacterium]|nr:MAG: hypothetical protein B5M55_06970 [Desulfococcus sp. 4484_242]RLC30578.1 MAG: hypothetical protein DRH37_05040 [Deltaproteobacteria bacterium]
MIAGSVPQKRMHDGMVSHDWGEKSTSKSAESKMKKRSKLRGITPKEIKAVRLASESGCTAAKVERDPGIGQGVEKNLLM